MTTLKPLISDTLITREYEHLTATRPVRVWTQVFDNLDGSSPDRAALDTVCGSAHPVHFSAIEPHEHEHHEISLILGGSARHRTAMHETTLQRGDVLVVAPGKVHALDQIDGLIVAICSYMTEWLFHDIKELWTMEGLIPHLLATGMLSHPEDLWIPQYRLNTDEFDACVHEMNDVALEWSRDKPSRAYLRWCVEKLMLTLGRVFSRSDEWAQLQTFHAEIQQALQCIETVIVECRPFNVSEVADELGMTPGHLSRLFKQVTGWSTMDYFQRRRIQHASWLLLNTSHSITDVAHTLGYCDSAHFAHLFKRFQGVSPRTYRKRQENA